MQAHDDRDQFAPPQPPARLRAISLAVLAHIVLIGALTWGVSWKGSTDEPAIEAELWAAVPQQAAPRAAEPPAPPPPPPAPAPPPRPPAPAPAPPPRAAQPPDTREADIAIEREKKRLEQEKKAQLEREKRERERKEEERRERAEQQKKERLEKEKEQREKQLAEQKKAAEREKAEQQKKLAEDNKRKAEEAKRKADAEAKQLAEQREANLRRLQGMAGATGGETATGTAQRSAGPSGSYGGKVAARVRPNIVYPDAISNNPEARVEVRLAPDGTIVGRRLTKSSGNRAWDEAVLRALDKTETLPRDVDGRVPPSLDIGFRPQD